MNRRGVPILYYTLIFLTGFSGALIYYGWLREFVLLFGAHMVSVVSIIVSACLVMAFGSRFSGRYADHALHAIRYYSIIQVILALFVFFQLPFFSFMSGFYFHLNELHQPAAFGNGLLRFICCILFFLIPSVLISSLIPFLVRHFIRHISMSGRFMSATLISVTLGLIAGMLFAYLLFIAGWGSSLLFICGGIICLLNGSIAFFFLSRSRRKINPVLQPAKTEIQPSAIRFKKKKVVLETGVKLMRAVMYGSAFQAFIFTSVFMLGLRILMNYNLLRPSYLYAVVFMLTMSGIALGGFLYIRIAEKPANKYMTLATLQIFAGLGALLSYILLNVLVEFFYKPRPDTVYINISAYRMLILASFTMLPAILYGMAFPLTGKLHPKRLQQVAGTFGRVGSLVFMSILAGIIITPFFFIPVFGLHLAYLILALFMLLSGIYLVSRDSRLMRGYRIGYAFTAIVLFVAIAGFFRVFNLRHHEGSLERKIEGSTATFGYSKTGQTKQIWLDGSLYLESNADNLSPEVLTASIPALLYAGQPKHALLIGFGTGVTARALDQFQPDEIFITEIFPEIIRLSPDVFADENNDMITNSRVDLSIEDGRSYLMRSSAKFDLIIAPTNLIYRFPGLYTSDFAEICKNHLTRNGLYCQVMPLHKLSLKEFLAMCKSFHSIFNDVSLWGLSSDNVLLVAANSPLKADYCNLIKKAQTIRPQTFISIYDGTDPVQILSRLIMMNENLEKLLPGIPENSDDHPYIEFNRDDLQYDYKGWPIFNEQPDFTKFIEYGDGCNQQDQEVLNRITLLNRSMFRQFSSSSPAN